jgi:hypothetical protein
MCGVDIEKADKFLVLQFASSTGRRELAMQVIDQADEDKADHQVTKNGFTLMHAHTSMTSDTADHRSELVKQKDWQGNSCVMRARLGGHPELACHLALKTEDMYSLAEAVEGAWEAGVEDHGAMQKLIKMLLQRCQDGWQGSHDVAIMGEQLPWLAEVIEDTDFAPGEEELRNHIIRSLTRSRMMGEDELFVGRDGAPSQRSLQSFQPLQSAESEGIRAPIVVKPADSFVIG